MIWKNRSESDKRHQCKKGAEATFRRSLGVEQLEERELLSVTPTEYSEIRNLYSDFLLPENSSAINIIELTDLTADSLQNAVNVAAQTKQDDLIVLRFCANSSALNLNESIKVNINAESSGDISIISYGPTLFQLSSDEKVIFSIDSGHVNLGGFSFIGQNDGGSNLDLIFVQDGANLSTERVIYFKGQANSKEGFETASAGTISSPYDDVGPTNADYMLSAELNIGGTEWAYVTGLSFVEASSLTEKVYNGLIEGNLVFDVNKKWDGKDDDLCWAATASNMLKYAGYDIGDTYSAEDVYDEFRYWFEDHPSNCYYGCEWFISSIYIGKYVDGGGHYPDVPITEVLGYIGYEDSNYSVSTAADFIRNSGAVGIGIEWPDAEIGHDVTMWGYCYNTQYNPSNPYHYTKLIISDSDDGMSRVYATPISYDYYGYYGDPIYYFTDYDADGSETIGYITDFVTLKKYDSSLIAKPNLAPYKPTEWDEAIVVSTYSEYYENSGIITTDNTIYVDAAFINSGSLSCENFWQSLVLKDSSGGTVHTVNIPLEGSLGPGSHSYVYDVEFGKLAAGTYTLTLTVDIEGKIDESDEWDNTYTKTFTVVEPPHDKPTTRYVTRFASFAGIYNNPDLNDGDIIEFLSAGTYFVKEKLNPLDKKITILGHGATLVGNSGGETPTYYDMFSLINSNASLTIDGLTIRDCKRESGSGGAFSVSSGELTLTNCQLIGCTATVRGGAIEAAAIANNECDAIIKCENTVFISNTANSGGAIFFDAKELAISGCTFDINHADGGNGGAIDLFVTDMGDSATITHTKFTNNGTSLPKGEGNIGDLAACGAGGAVQVWGISDVEVLFDGCAFKANYAKVGGAIAVGQDDKGYANVKVTDMSVTNALDDKEYSLVLESSFTSNTALYGGAVFAGGIFTQVGGLYQGNIAKRNGGAISSSSNCSDGALVKTESSNAYRYTSLKAVTFDGNQAQGIDDTYGCGGAIINEKDLIVDECIFYANQATVNGGAIDNIVGKASSVALTVKDSTFGAQNVDDKERGNTARNGGAILNWGTLTFAGTNSFAYNTARQNQRGIGGAVANAGLVNCDDSAALSFDNNQAAFGGAFANYTDADVYTNVKAVLNNVSFTRNSASVYGGAAYNYANGKLFITGNTFTLTGNNAVSCGGGYCGRKNSLFSYDVQATSPVTISGNVASSGPGNIFAIDQGELRGMTALSGLVDFDEKSGDVFNDGGTIDYPEDALEQEIAAIAQDALSTTLKSDNS